MKWLALWLALAALWLVIVFAAPANAYTCDLVQKYRSEIQSMPRSERRKWIKRLRITAEQIRQARACLRGG